MVPFCVWGYNTGSLVCNVEVTCELSMRKRDEWRIKTFNAILAAYNKQLSDYNDWQEAQEIASGVIIKGNNPDMNRRIEREELKKLCIELMTGQAFEAFNAVNSNVAPLGYPEVIPDKAFEQGKHIQFFEQAIDWEQSTYVFYPYFWGRKANWVMLKSINDTDPIFTSFLQAGAARVLVPTRPGFEGAINYFLATQRIWNGKNPTHPRGSDVGFDRRRTQGAGRPVRRRPPGWNSVDLQGADFAGLSGEDYLRAEGHRRVCRLPNRPQGGRRRQDIGRLQLTCAEARARNGQTVLPTGC